MNFAVFFLVAVVTAGLIPNCFSVQNENAGIGSRVTNNGGFQDHEYADESETATLINRLRHARLADINVKQRNLEYSVYNIRNNGVSVGSSSLKITPGVIVLKASGVDLGFSGSLSYKKKVLWFHVRDTTNFNLNARGIGFSLTVRFGTDSSGRPVISSGKEDCKAWVHGISIRFHGGASWLYNLFTGFLEKKMKERLGTLICTEGRKLVNKKAATSLAALSDHPQASSDQAE